ncbi:MAG TPA: adenylate/guanylate cyclase domain-containing protein [Spirochaetes bacterium]|nr:adenylate/guanylate cyclase domain-containing protein [Spirochaetota bacterium]
MINSRTLVTGASKARLDQLILSRLQPGTDKKEIDKRIWDLFGEVWCVMFTDLSGFSRGVAEYGIIHFLQTIHESERLFIPIIEENDGILIKAEGDSLLVIFKQVDKALKAAITMQKACKEYNQNKGDTEKVLLCLGLGYGEILKIGDDDVFGREVNAASKLGEDTAEPWEILVTESIKVNTSVYKDHSFNDLAHVPSGIDKAFKFTYDLG